MRGRTKTWVAIALVALLALAMGLAACGGSSDSGGASSSAAATGEPVKGGTLTVTYQGEPTELDPAIAWEVTSWSIERLTYQTFLTYANEPGEAGTQLVPDLATEVPTAENGGISADGKTYTFHLKQGVKFAPPVDREITAADFKYSFERMMVEPLAPATFFYEGIVGATEFMDGKAKEISGYKVVDDYTVEITLKAPEGSFLLAMTHAVHVGRAGGVGQAGRQADQAQAARHGTVHHHRLDGRAVHHRREEPELEPGRPPVGRRHEVPLHVQPEHGAASARTRRGGRPRRRGPGGRLPAHQAGSQVDRQHGRTAPTSPRTTCS